MLFGIMETRRDRKMLDKTLPYAEIWMTRPLQQNVPITPLAEGFEFRFYQKEDESAWAEIETSVGEFQTTDEALEYFQQNFAPYPEELERRMFFVETKKGEKVATCTAWRKIKRASVSGFSLVSSETRLPRKRARKSIDCQSLARISYPPYGRTNLSSHTDMEPSGDCSL